jgi:hypothetical protein
MFKYVMLKRRIRKKQIFKKKKNSCVFIWKRVNRFQFETIQVTTRVEQPMSDHLNV